MTENITVEQKAPGCEGAKHSRTGSVLLAAALLLAGFAAGIYCERSWHAMDTLLEVVRGSTAVLESDRDNIASDGPAEPGTLEAQLTQQIRSLHSEVAQLNEEAKEGRIQFNLLLQRGYSKDDAVCVSLLARQQEIKERIGELKDSAQEAEGLRQRLVATIKDLADSGQSDGVNKTLRADVLRLIHRAGLQDTAPTVIPDAVWVKPEASEGIMETESR